MAQFGPEGTGDSSPPAEPTAHCGCGRHISAGHHAQSVFMTTLDPSECLIVVELVTTSLEVQKAVLHVWQGHLANKGVGREEHPTRQLVCCLLGDPHLFLAGHLL